MKYENLSNELKQQALEMELNYCNQDAKERGENQEYFEDDDVVQELLHLTDYEIVHNEFTSKETLIRR